MAAVAAQTATETHHPQKKNWYKMEMVMWYLFCHLLTPLQINGISFNAQQYLLSNWSHSGKKPFFLWYRTYTYKYVYCDAYAILYSYVCLCLCLCVICFNLNLAYNDEFKMNFKFEFSTRFYFCFCKTVIYEFQSFISKDISFALLVRLDFTFENLYTFIFDARFLI